MIKITTPFTLVHYVKHLKVNGKIARRDSGNAARSLRSLRDDGVDIQCARASLPILPTPLERSERSEQEGVTPSLSCDYLVHSPSRGEVNEVNEVSVHV